MGSLGSKLPGGAPAQVAGALGIIGKKRIMNKSNRLWRGIAVGTISLALVGGVGLPVSAWASANNSSGKSCKVTEHRQAMRAMHEKMLAQEKAEDAALQKLVAELNKAPEAKKVDLEAAILTKLVAQHHQMLGEWETLHARRVAFWKEHTQKANAGTSGSSTGKTVAGHSTATAQK